MVANGWIDFAEKMGEIKGAYCMVGHRWPEMMCLGRPRVRDQLVAITLKKEGWVGLVGLQV